MTQAYFVLALIALSAVNCSTLKPLSENKRFSALVQIDSNPLGNTIMSLLQVHTEAEGLIGDIMQMIEDLGQEISGDQEDADSLHSTYRTMCNTNIPDFTQKQVYHEEQRDNNIKTQEDTQTLLDTAGVDLAATITNIEYLTQQIASRTLARQNEAAQFLIDDMKAQQALDALDEAIRLVTNLYTSSQTSTFIQIRNKLQSVTENLQQMEHLEKFSFYGPIVKSLMQIATSDDSTPNSIREILDLLTDLRTSIKEQKDLESLNETNLAGLWVTQLADLTGQKLSAQTRKGEYENNIINYNRIITEAVEAEKTHDDEQLRYQGLLNTQVNECEDEQETYDEETAQRTSDLDILARLMQYMEDNVATLEDYMLERVNNVQ